MRREDFDEQYLFFSNVAAECITNQRWRTLSSKRTFLLRFSNFPKKQKKTEKVKRSFSSSERERERGEFRFSGVHSVVVHIVTVHIIIVEIEFLFLFL